MPTPTGVGCSDWLDGIIVCHSSDPQASLQIFPRLPSKALQEVSTYWLHPDALSMLQTHLRASAVGTTPYSPEHPRGDSLYHELGNPKPGEQSLCHQP